MGKLQQNAGVLNAGDELRQLIAACEKMLASLSPQNARILMQSATEAHVLHAELERAGGDMRPEAARLDTIDERIVKNAKRMVEFVGGVSSFQQLRQQVNPGATEAWWRLDDVLAAQRRTTLTRIAVVGVVVLLVGAMSFLLRDVLFPPDPVGDAVFAAQRAVEQNDTKAALQAVEAGLTTVPSSTTLLVWRALILELRGDMSAADVFAQARATVGERAFLLERAQVDLMLGNNDRVVDDMTALTRIDPDAPEPYFLRAAAFENKREFNLAMTDLERAADIAQRQGNDTLYATARVRLGTLMQSAPQNGAGSGSDASP